MFTTNTSKRDSSPMDTSTTEPATMASLSIAMPIRSRTPAPTATSSAYPTASPSPPPSDQPANPPPRKPGPLRSIAQPAPTKPAPDYVREVHIIWKRDCAAPWATALRKHISANKLSLAAFDDPTIAVFRSTTAAQFRDMIRGKFELEALGAQIKALQMRLPRKMKLVEHTWDRAKEVLFAGGYGGSEIMLILRLREEEEGEEEMYEAEGE